MTDERLKVDPHGDLKLSPEQQLREKAAVIAAKALSGYDGTVKTQRLVPKIAEQVYDYIKDGVVS